MCARVCVRVHVCVRACVWTYNRKETRRRNPQVILQRVYSTNRNKDLIGTCTTYFASQSKQLWTTAQCEASQSYNIVGATVETWLVSQCLPRPTHFPLLCWRCAKCGRRCCLPLTSEHTVHRQQGGVLLTKGGGHPAAKRDQKSLVLVSQTAARRGCDHHSPLYLCPSLNPCNSCSLRVLRPMHSDGAGLWTYVPGGSVELARAGMASSCLA